IPICLQMSPKAFPEMIRMIERFPQAKIILDHCARPVLNDGPPYAHAQSLFDLARYPNIYLKLTQRNFTESQNVKASPDTFFPTWSARSAPGAWPGARTSRRPKVRSPVCWRSRGAPSPACRQPSRTGFSPRRRRRCTQRWPIEGLQMSTKITLKTMLGDYPTTLALKKGEVSSSLVDFQFADVKVPNTAFKRLVRDKEFDFSELAIVTYLQAKNFGTPYVLLPVTVVGRGQHHTLAYNPENGPLRPQDLNG